MNPGDRLGDYRLLNRLAHGGMGEVWEAEGPGERVAVKVIPEFLLGDPALVERLRREAEAAGRLNHPGVVKIHGFGEAPSAGAGRAFLVMELLKGETLADRMVRENPMPIPDIERIAIALIDALAYVHGRGIIHRDLKPQNIFLTESGGVKLIDLGVAKVLDEASMTVTGSHFGTPAYMSPDSFRDSKSVTAAADIWSYGVMLYEMATGRMPFPGTTAASIIMRISDTKAGPQPPTLLRPDLPERVLNIISACLRQNPQERPSAGDLVFQWTGRRPAGRRKYVLGRVFLLSVIVVSAGYYLTRRADPPPQNREPQKRETPVAGPELPQVEAAIATVVHTVRAGFTVLDASGVKGERGFEGPRRIRHDASGYELMLVPSGSFFMGSAEDAGEEDELPRHRVSLDAYWLGTTEVTRAQFAAFVAAGGYRTDAERGRGGKYGTANSWMESKEVSWRSPMHPGDTDAPWDHPVTQVSPLDAEAWCGWAGLRLPTEAEWEKAARGTDDRIYPWGDADDLARRNGRGGADGFQYTSPVSRFLSGVSPYGMLDMAGNVFEHCADWYGADYYSVSDSANPAGPRSGPYRVIRGGAWHGGAGSMRAANRPPKVAAPIASDIGFRAACSPSADTSAP